MSSSTPDAETISELYDMANKLRIDAIASTTKAKSGHPTSCSSMAEITAVLFFHTMRFSLKSPRDPSSDRFILSKGHAAPILYAAWAEAGLFPVSELMNLRKLPYDLEGHPTPRLNFIDVGTGSLGQGLSISCGMAYCGKYFDNANFRVYCLIGDGESAEGSIWEAFSFARNNKLDNLCVIIDVNRLGQSQPTPFGHNVEIYKKRVEAFGCHGIIVDGHSVEALCAAFDEAKTIKDKPTCLVAKTFKGKHFLEIEDKLGWHGKPLGNESEKVIENINKLISNKCKTKLKVTPPEKNDAPCVCLTGIELDTPPSYKLGDKLATRVAYGNAIAKLVKNHPRVIALDGDMRNSTYSEKVLAVDKTKHVECFIAEQNLVGVAIGLACRNRCVAFTSTFGAFYCRAYDQIRMGAISQTNINLVGSHCGVSIGEDGPSQMALEDLAMFRAVPGSTIFYPSDGVSTERAVELAANTEGICYIRVSRPETTILYESDEKFEIGQAKIVAKSSDDICLVIAAAVTLTEVLTAKKILDASGIHIRVMDPFTIKPLDARCVLQNAQQCGGKIITVEDHFFEGGIGDAVLSVVAESRGIVVRKMAVPKVPRSGPTNALLDYYGISSKHIVEAVQDVCKCGL